MRTGEEGWMNAQKREVRTVQNADFRSKKDTESAPLLDEIGTHAGKERGADGATGAVGKWMGKDNFSGGKKSF